MKPIAKPRNLLQKLKYPVISLCSAYLYIALEWIFFTTKPSFFSSFSLLEKVQVFAVVTLQFSVIFILISLIFSALLHRYNKITKFDLSKLQLIPSVALLALAVLLLIDNFTNTIIGYGISKSSGFLRLLYAPGLLFIAYQIFKTLAKLEFAKITLKSLPVLLGGALICASTLLAIGTLIAHISNNINHDINPSVIDASRTSERPNIIFFATDGIPANLVSGYGNKNITTKNLDKLMANSLVAKNAFTNSERTTGSTTSMLTGKYPTTIKVLFPPHVLQGEDAFQHLPAILKNLGYKNFQESVRYYADANDLNFIQGFDLANGIENTNIATSNFSNPSNVNLFIKKLQERIVYRLKHIFFIKKMTDVFASVKSNSPAKVYGITDRSRIDRSIAFIKETKQPFFMHLHLMDTHCCRFNPANRIFSNKQFTTQAQLERALLEDLLKRSDEYLGELITTLEETGKFDNTIIVYTSDHTDRWGFRNSIPLIFTFPKGQHKGEILENTQLLDISPTILDHLNLQKPDWMEGRSLLKKSINPYQPIFGVTQLQRGHFMDKNDDRLSHIIGNGPPLYGLNIMGMIVCDTWYLLNIKTREIQSGAVQGHTGGCDSTKIPDAHQAEDMILNHLHSNGFDTESPKS